MKLLLMLPVALPAIVSAQTLNPEQLTSLRETVREMCLLPDRSGEYLRADGEAKVGSVVPVKIMRGDLSGKISYEAWKGIPITLDKYKTDPRECAVEMMRLLLPTFSISSNSKSSESLFDRRGMRLGMSRSDFDDVTAGLGVEWQSTDKGTRGFYETTFQGIKVWANHYFQSGQLKEVEYFRRATFTKGESKGSRDSSYRKDEYANKIRYDEMLDACESYQGLSSKIIGKLGDPMVPETKKEIDHSDWMRQSYLCESPAACELQGDNKGNQRILRFRLQDRVLATLTIEAYHTGFKRTSADNVALVRNEGCWFSMALTLIQ